MLVLTGFPCVRPELVYFVNALTKKISLMVCGHIIVVSFYISGMSGSQMNVFAETALASRSNMGITFWHCHWPWCCQRCRHSNVLG